MNKKYGSLPRRSKRKVKKRSGKNKGEWAEIYAFASVLADGKIRIWSHDSLASPKYLKVNEVRRDIVNNSEHVKIGRINLDLLHVNRKIPRELVSKQLNQFRLEILGGASRRKGEKGAFRPPHGETIMKQLAFMNDGSKNRTKSDLYIDVEDPLVGQTGLQGYTIKSFMGAPPTLLNPSGATRFTYSISSGLTKSRLMHLRQLKEVRLKFQMLERWGYKLKLSEMNETFRLNLEMIDTRMPELVAELLRSFTAKEHGDSSVSFLVSEISRRNPLRVSKPDLWYSHKVKELLEASSYGMVPNTLWDGRRSAAGGLIIVDSTGTVFCLPHRSRDANREFLYSTTSLVSPGHSEDLEHGLLTGSGRNYSVRSVLQIRYRSLPRV